MHLVWNSEKLKEGWDLAGAGGSEGPNMPHNNLVSQQTGDSKYELQQVPALIIVRVQTYTMFPFQNSHDLTWNTNLWPTLTWNNIGNKILTLTWNHVKK